MSADPSGWMPGAVQVRTEAYGDPSVAEDSQWPRAVMSHVMEGWKTTMEQWARERPYRTRKSAHFLIGLEGAITQCVSIWDPSWAAGTVTIASPVLDAQIARWGRYPNLWVVNIEHEGFYHRAEWPAAQVEASRHVHEWIFDSCAVVMIPSEETVITHSMTDGRDRVNDPGPAWMGTVRPELIRHLRERSDRLRNPQPEPPPASPEPVEGPAHDLEGARNDLRTVMARAADGLVKLGG